MTDYQKRTYDDLVAEEAAGGWDQVTYSATIQYIESSEYSPELEMNAITPKILIQVEQGKIDVNQLGQHTGHIKETIDMIHVYIEVSYSHASMITDKQYLRTVLTAFEAWYKAKAYKDTELFGIYPTTKKFRMDCWLRIFEVA